MKLRTRLMMFTAVAALSANMAFAAIDAKTLADRYIAEGYTYVEVKVGPTQTKLEAVKGDRKVEVIYDNVSEEVIKSEFEAADDDYLGRTGIEIEDVSDDFIDEDDADDEDDDADDDEGDDDEGDDDEGDDDEGDDDEGDDEDEDEDEDDEGDDEGDDNSGSGGGDEGDDEGGN